MLECDVLSSLKGQHEIKVQRIRTINKGKDEGDTVCWLVMHLACMHVRVCVAAIIIIRILHVSIFQI